MLTALNVEFANAIYSTIRSWIVDISIVAAFSAVSGVGKGIRIISDARRLHGVIGGLSESSH